MGLLRQYFESISSATAISRGAGDAADIILITPVYAGDERHDVRYAGMGWCADKLDGQRDILMELATREKLKLLKIIRRRCAR